MPTNQKHTLVTLADLLRVVTVDNLDSLVADMRGLLVNAVLTKTLMDAAHVTNDVFANAKIVWCDDNVNEQRFTATSPDGNELQFVTKATSPDEPEDLLP